MIYRDEVDAMADAVGLQRADVERDYVLGWLLAGIFGESSLGQTLALKGGNALRKGYLPETRFSDDLDFTTANAVGSTSVLAQLNDVCRFVEARTGVAFDLDRNDLADARSVESGKRLYKARLYFKDFIAGRDHLYLKIRVDVTEYDRVYLPIRSVGLIHPYSDASECAGNIRCISLEEVLADKLKCLLQRRHAFDLFDLVYAIFISQSVEVNRQDVVSVFLRKTIFGNSPPAAKGLLAKMAFEALRRFWDKIVAPIQSRFSFDRATSLLLESLDTLFAPFGPGMRSALAFYPAELRNTIIAAGAEQRLLRFRYRGADRMVEPYKLAFNARQDGVAQEYLYAFDVTGGNSGPGIKTFFHHGISSLEPTDVQFEPRFEIELAKAGDASMAGAFAGRRTAFGFRRLRSARSYRVRCSACDRVLTRSRPGTMLRPHTDPAGFRCFGRHGYPD